jgi:hypothetical protein
VGTEWIALIGTVAGGIGLKITESILSRGTKKADTATAMRAELRQESVALREELRAVEKELDEWRDKYYELMQELVDVKSSLGAPPQPNRPVTQRNESDW